MKLQTVLPIIREKRRDCEHGSRGLTDLGEGWQWALPQGVIYVLLFEGREW